MALYIDKKIEDPLAGPQKTLLTWHKCFPIVAVASYDDNSGGVVSIYTNDCSVVRTKISPRLGIQVTAVEWHPTKKCMVIGWESGDLAIWSEIGGREIYSFTKHHNNVVCSLAFNENGKFFVTGDIDGSMFVWKFDAGGSFEIVLTQSLKYSIVDMVFRTNCNRENEGEISRLARAAVDGDERALNMFSSWEDNEFEQRLSFVNKDDDFELFVGCQSGIVFFMKKNGYCEGVLQMETSIRYLAYYQEKDILIVLSKSLILAQFSIEQDGSVRELRKIKLSGRNTDVVMVWAGESLLAISTGENSVHLWNVNSGQSSTLVIPDFALSQQITHISFMAARNVLTAGTIHGFLFSWQLIDVDDDDEIVWEVEKLLQVHGNIRSFGWCEALETMAMITSRDTYIISKQKMCFAFSDGLSAVQMAARQVVIELVSQELSVHLLTEMEIKAVYMSKNTVALHCSDKLIFYEVNFDDKKTMHLGTFAVSSNCILLHDQSVYVKSEGKIDVKTFQGTLKAYFQFTKDEGEPLVMGASGDFFVAASTTSVTKIWDISGREAKLVLSSNDAKNIIKDKQITSIACNHKGNKVSFTVCIKTKTGSIFDPHLFVWDIEKNVFSQFDFATGQGNKPDDKISNTSDLSAMVSGRFPVQHFWVQEDPRLVVCEAKLLPLPLKKNFANSSFRKMLNKQKKNSIVDTEKKPETVVVSLYVTPDKVLIVQDYFALDENQANLLGVKIPYYYILQKKADPASDEKVQEVKGHKSLVERKTMQNFIGLESCDNATKEALLNFSYFFAAGSFDEAFSAIKTIDSESVWENMAKMCVKTKRLDVAKICVGKMGLTFAIKALNKAAKEPQLEVKIGILAIHLEMYDEAEKLFRSCGRYDWVNKLCQCRGQWQKALEIAEAKDRIHLRDTFYNYANFLEREGDIHNAIKFYEKSGTHHFEIPRMLFDDPRALEAYVQKSKDPEIHRWWAQYLESIDEMETALHYYKTAEDYLSLVRLYCYCNNLEKAAEIANETGNRAACFHLGRQFENQDNIKEAIHFFTQARAFTNAIRICKENNLEEQLMNLAMMAGPAEKADVAQHFQQQGNISNAISLYHKAGNLEYAVELAFQEGEYDVLQKIATELPPDADPQLLQQCAEFFIQRGRFDTAVNLFIMAKKYEEALNLCVENNVKIGEELAEKFTLDKNETDKQLRIFILEKIGESCMIQENYHLAAKKFTQAGDKIKAMKALLKSGDTDRIIFFANVSRQREIYVMAANYLQTLDWRNNGDVVKHIITFYTKGKALDLLSSFYEACAQDEIDEYQNYEKALEALTEAYKCQAKNSGSSNSDKLQTLKSKIEIISKFVEIRHLYESNPEDAVKECRDLLHLENVEAAVRRGDIYGFLVEHFCSRENYKVAYSILEQMQSTLPGINLPYYIKVDNLKAIYKALDLKPHKENEFSVSKKDSENDLSDTEEIEEEYQAVENRFL